MRTKKISRKIYFICIKCCSIFLKKIKLILNLRQSCNNMATNIFLGKEWKDNFHNSLVKKRRLVDMEKGKKQNVQYLCFVD